VPGNHLAPAPIMTLYELRDAAYEAAYRDGVEFVDPAPRPNTDGHSYMSAAAPIRDREGKVVAMFGLDLVADKLEARLGALRSVLFTALFVVGVLSIVAGAIAHQMRKFAAAIVHKMRAARAEAERNAQRAEAASEAKAKFLAMMSHEIRTPMNGMLGVADLLRNMSPDPSQKKLLDILAGSGDSLLRIINDILDFSKIEADHLELHPQPFEPRPLFDEIEALLGTQLHGKPLKLRVDVDAQLPSALHGDRQRLAQVLLNLGNNAIKFTDHGEVRIHVRCLSPADGRASLAITVSDTGIGMSEEAQRRLFVPFTQLAEGRQQGGTGLGLVISQKLVKLMGGDIRVASEPGKGSTFTFALEMPVAEMPSLPAKTRSSGSAETSILVAEDNAVNQTIIQAMLKQLGYRSTLVANGRDALAALAAQPFDLVLMDCNMPVLDGLETTRRLRAGEAGGPSAATPVIALTANAMDSDRERCLAAGMNDFLPKPVSIAALRAAIERVRISRDSTTLRAAV
jgi:signal transduction histidine kinase/AmiR/NasT family two-component response regulator